MLFLEIWFWVFAALAVPVYWLCPRVLKLPWLLAASAVFQYHFAGSAGMTPILVLGALTWAAPLVPWRRRGPSPIGATAVVVVGALVFYKYAEFFLRTAHDAGLAPATALAWKAPAMPLGISFFTFEFLHYLYEVHLGKPPVRNPLHFSVFAIFFPTLAAGPIKRYPDFVPQLRALHTPPVAVVGAGLGRVIRGLFKKVCVADLVLECVKVLEQSTMNAPIVVALAVAQGFRIYYDFAGYSDIAIGLAQMLGVRVPENFDRPYWSTTLQEFWRRWHMSLSSWIRDYIYIPLGGNRAHRVFNLLAAMILCGLWHGAAIHFAAWGVYHGAGLAAEGVVRRLRPAWFGPGVVPQTLGWLVTYAFVSFGWLVFFYPLHTVLDMTRALTRWPAF